MGGVGTSIIGRPRRLPSRHPHASRYTLDCEEPAILASIRPRDLAGKTRRRLAAEQLTELAAVDKKTKELTKELKVMVISSGSDLMNLRGVGPVVAARTLADVGDVASSRPDRFRVLDRTAPLDASSGDRTGTACRGPGTGG